MSASGRLSTAECQRAWRSRLESCLNTIPTKSRSATAVSTSVPRPGSEPSVTNAFPRRLRRRSRSRQWLRATVNSHARAALLLVVRSRDSSAIRKTSWAASAASSGLRRMREQAGSVLIARVAAVAAVPLILVSVQSSSSPRQLVQPGPAPASVARSTSIPAPDPASPVFPSEGGQVGASAASALPAKVPIVVAHPDSLVPGSTATLKSAVDAVRQLLSPLPSVSPVVTLPPVLPSVPTLPSPR